MLALLLLALRADAVDLREIIARVAEEAEVFRQMAPQALAEETLRQRALKPRRRFRLRIGNAARRPPAPEYQTRVIVSEYSVGPLREAPESLHEFRQVVSVDGRKITSSEKARERLMLGIHSEDDRARRRMLDELEKYGLIGAVTDAAPMLLLFRKRRLEDFTFEAVGEEMVAGEAARVIAYHQSGGRPGIAIFSRRQAWRQPLEGRIYVRKSDGLPLRITVSTLREEKGSVYRNEAIVDYTLTQHGFLAPLSVVHRESIDGNVVAENDFHYSRFKKFGASTEIKFTEIPEK